MGNLGPARIIILRHGEKKNKTQLCVVGALRAQALSDEYLGKAAPGNDAIFGAGGTPDSFLAVTRHTQETAAPSAQTWGKKLIIFSDSDLDLATQNAAAALNSAEYDGKIVVVVWEHQHIARQDLNGKSATFWALLKLGDIPGAAVPENWEGANYDYFWIVDYTNAQPAFTTVQQEYPAPAYSAVPNNLWGANADPTKFSEFCANCKP
jgi:hypothetical protein